MWLKLPVQFVEHDAGLDRATRALDVELEDAREISGTVDDQRLADRLPGLRGTTPARQHADALGASYGDGAFGLFDAARGDHADGHDLVVRGVGGVAAAAEAVELHFASQFGL